MIGLIIAEASLLAIFVVAYLFYLGKSLNGPYPKEVLEVPIFNTVCLLASSVTVGLAVRALRQGDRGQAGMWLPLTALLGGIFLAGTAREWYRLIVDHGLTIGTNLFGTTFYSLVGFHAFHVTVGVMMLALLSAFLWSGTLRPVGIPAIGYLLGPTRRQTAQAWIQLVQLGASSFLVEAATGYATNGRPA
jgi:cytochrome c oxidase subunit 3/cytochrome o ubiquinol oxidase subunit 3